VHTHNHGHSHAAPWVVKAAIAITLGLVATEFVVGTIAHSLALVSDAWHNLTDVPSLVLAAVAIHWEHRPPDHQKTFGYQRAGVLAAFVNSLVMIAVAVFLCFKGYERVMDPQPIATGAMLWVGVVAMLVNGAITLGLAGDRRDLNMRAVFIHNLGDALSSIGIVAGAWLIFRTGQSIIDPILAFLIAGMILWSALGIAIESTNILLESLPKGMSLENVATAMLGVPGVCEVHDVHIWSLGSQSRALSCHVRILDMPTSESEIICHQLNEVVSRQFGITHTTIQFEHTHPPGDFHRYMPEPAAKKAQ
jgi:cobalt-zinc-cadmium efflux system protein